jgi:FSR family fosmidomycin resistance protein-like MFS transporter
VTKRRQLFLMASLLHILNDGCRVAIVALVPLVTETLGLSYTQVGLLGTVLSGIQTATALPASLAAQRLGDILVLQFGLLLYALPSSLIGWVTGYPFLLLLFCAAGIGFGVFHPVGSAFVAKVSPPQRLGRSLGAFTSAGDIGKVGLPALITLLLTRTSLTVTSSAQVRADRLECRV